jgi:hypothetical protein
MSSVSKLKQRSSKNCAVVIIEPLPAGAGLEYWTAAILTNTFSRLRRLIMPDNEIVEVSNVSTMLTPDRIIERSKAIHAIMKEAMKDGTDYGVIQGCGSKPTLLKPGAEKLLMMFQVAPRVTVTDLSAPPDVYRYRVQVSLISQSGVYLGDGIGECTSLEKKWHERRDGTVLNASDSCNTILKMAKKRALVDAVLTVLGASDIFTQDVEDMEPEKAAAKPVSKPAFTKEPAKPKDDDALTTGQLAWLEKNAPLVWTAEQIEKWLAAHKVLSYAELTYGDARQLHKELVTAFEDKTKSAE